MLAFDVNGASIAEGACRPIVDQGRRVGAELAAARRSGAGQLAGHGGDAARPRRLRQWVAGGILATHHYSAASMPTGQVRRASVERPEPECYMRKAGTLGGQKKVRDLIGGPWAIRYSLSHLVKDNQAQEKVGAERADCVARSAGRLIPHRSFGVCSVSAAASTAS